MAYITKEQVQEKREQIKKLFPASQGWKFSIRLEHYSSINLVILKAPINFLENSDRKYDSVNHYYIDEHYTGQAKEVLNRIYGILNKGNFDKSDTYTDYHHVGFYVNITIGKWDKEFVYEPNEKFKGVQPPNFIEFAQLKNEEKLISNIAQTKGSLIDVLHEYSKVYNKDVEEVKTNFLNEVEGVVTVEDSDIIGENINMFYTYKI